ncbi:Oidioi.mRNA.OKI2018_I69.chr2.g4334.t3.cds [Oikopleura dioica]|uniref:Oidioi.mRNA.OKI2018_I69.chr2.g4334.t3.cds n=1 Tax=Oikopleura dioica TaxID=34765 RepID=A0ABN7SXG0_OIKDI|nr:Oidioi.mRNA.OKI2018_I69.chr2.g4334.t3.cds [Oikopleura dioica]
MQESPAGVEKSPSVDLDGQRLTAKSTVESVPINVAPSPSSGPPAPPKSPLIDSPRKSSRVPVSKVQLTMEMCKGRLSDLGDGLHFRTMCLSNLGLDFLGANILKFKLINNLNIAHNNITSLGKHIGQLENLLKVDVSHNRLTKAFDFTSAGMLQYADFSHNRIEDVDNASNHKYLRELNLSHNNIDDIRALSRLKQLKSLNLSYNELRQAEGLEDLPLLKLDLSSNKLQNVFDVVKLKFLLVLDISNNQISDIKPLVEANLVSFIKNRSKVTFIQLNVHMNKLYNF